jgi:hypothetical protein
MGPGVLCRENLKETRLLSYLDVKTLCFQVKYSCLMAILSNEANCYSRGRHFGKRCLQQGRAVSNSVFFCRLLALWEYFHVSLTYSGCDSKGAKMGFGETKWIGTDRINLAQDRDQH